MDQSPEPGLPVSPSLTPHVRSRFPVRAGAARTPRRWQAADSARRRRHNAALATLVWLYVLGVLMFGDLAPVWARLSHH